MNVNGEKKAYNSFNLSTFLIHGFACHVYITSTNVKSHGQAHKNKSQAFHKKI
jgi:hypothetical protein